MTKRLNIADRLRHSARLVPQSPAICVPEVRDHRGRTAWTMISFEDLDAEVDAAARGLLSLGVRPGQRLVLMVRPSIEFIALTFAVFRAGAVCVLIDPGMGKSSVLRCLDEVEPDGFLAIPAVHFLRRLMPWRYRSARFNVIVRPGRLKFGCVSDFELVEFGRSSATSLPTTAATPARCTPVATTATLRCCWPLPSILLLRATLTARFTSFFSRLKKVGVALGKSSKMVCLNSFRSKPSLACTTGLADK